MCLNGADKSLEMRANPSDISFGIVLGLQTKNSPKCEGSKRHFEEFNPNHSDQRLAPPPAENGDRTLIWETIEDTHTHTHWLCCLR